MWRIFFGVGLLAALLSIGLFSAQAIEKGHEPIAITLEQAADAAPEEAKALLTKAKEEWESRWHGTAALADHSPMDEIDSLFSQAQAYAREENMADLAAFCLRLAQLIRATADEHQPTWWNFL